MTGIRRFRQAGSATIEMTLVGIPIIFTLISIWEISRGMWYYHTLAHAISEAARYASVHGQNCTPNPPTTTNDCRTYMGSGANGLKGVARVIVENGIGLLCQDGTYSCIGITTNPSAGCATLQACLASNARWPPDTGLGEPISISIIMPFYSALAMFWPGSPQVSFGVTNLGATARENIQF